MDPLIVYQTFIRDPKGGSDKGDFCLGYTRMVPPKAVLSVIFTWSGWIDSM